MKARLPAFVGRYAPMLAFTAVYTFTCLGGAILLLVNWRPFVALYEYFSGTDAPVLHGSQLRDALVLLIGAPLLLWATYALALNVPLGGRRLERLIPSQQMLRSPTWLPHACFYVLCLLGYLTLYHAGAFSHISAWRNYSAWINARESIFAGASFPEFVNIYLLVPLCAAWIVVTTPQEWRRLTVAVPPIVLTVVLQLLLYQKKAALVALLIVLASWLALISRSGRLRWLRWSVPSAAVALVGIYLALVVAPVYSQASNAVQQAIEIKNTTQASGGSTHLRPTAPTKTQQQTRLAHLAKEVNVKDRRQTIALYSVLSAMTRTSVPALYYPVVFPRHHAFYGLGIGNGGQADDNRVVWDYMNPSLPGGTVTAPFQFVFYALFGLFGALVATALTGVGLGIAWRIALNRTLPLVWTSLWASMVILLGIYLAIDSAQNSIIVSYGVVWGFLFIAGAAAAVWLGNQLHALSAGRVSTRVTSRRGFRRTSQAEGRQDA